MRTRPLAALGLILTLAPLVPAPAAAPADAPLPLMARSRVKNARGEHVVQVKPLHWNPKQTAVIICDMWDDHYCRNAARRVAEMAPVMNEVVAEARRRGMLIIHSPSGCMDVYKDTPQRRLAQQAPKASVKVPLQGWCHLDPKREPPLPVDVTEPCDDEKPRERIRFYNRQIDTIRIEEGDAITDSAEALGLMQQRGIENVIIMGVHTNMCVLGRPFGIRQLVYQGKNVVLMRDMTDAMYSPTQPPKVTHCRGTELVIEHIEKYWCPTVTSTDLTGGPAFRFAEDKRPHVVFVVGGEEYDASTTMPALADELRQLGASCEVLLGRGQKAEDYTIPGLDALKKADLMVLFLRRRALPPGQLQRIRGHLDAGKPLVALRTTSHGFEVASPPAGRATWDGFDVEVLGCDYRGHGPGNKGAEIAVAEENASHPILAGIAPRKWHSAGSLYSAEPLDKKAAVLLRGTSPGYAEPVAWTRKYRDARVFYTSLGHRDDLDQPQVRRLLVNAMFWAMDRPAPAR